MKGNYLWPAMWSPRKFYADDPANGELANELGIVMGTSHHEPLARAHAEWKPPFAKGPWNYSENKDELEEFWKGGIPNTYTARVNTCVNVNAGWLPRTAIISFNLKIIVIGIK